MYTKQIKVMSKGKVHSFLLMDTERGANQAGVAPLFFLKAEEAAKLVQNNPSKIPPYNAVDMKTGDIIVKQKGMGEVFKKMMGASTKAIYNYVEQYTGVIDAHEFDIGLPVVSGVYLYKDTVGNLMLTGKLISDLDDRKYMYSMIQRLSALQQIERENGGSQTKVGILKGRAATEDNHYEILSDFIVSTEALKILEEEGFGFFVNTTAVQEFDYKKKFNSKKSSDTPTSAEINDFVSWCKEHNTRVTSKLNNN